MRPIILLAALSLALSGCEKDDICDPDTATTPRLILSFFDINDPTVAKNVTNLAVIGQGTTDTLEFNGVSEIELPLKTTADITEYSFVLNSNDVNVDNEGRFSVNYLRDDVFVSRACGYKTVFNLIDGTPVTISDASPSDGFWIQDFEINQPAINNEDETHISIYF